MAENWQESYSDPPDQAAFLPRLTFAHLARCAAAILRRAEADMVRFLGTSAMPFAFAHRAL